MDDGHTDLSTLHHRGILGSNKLGRYCNAGRRLEARSCHLCCYWCHGGILASVGVIRVLGFAFVVSENVICLLWPSVSSKSDMGSIEIMHRFLFVYCQLRSNRCILIAMLSNPAVLLRILMFNLHFLLYNVED